jgi:hypothetical protein
MNLESTRPRGRPRNRWQDEVKEDGRIVGGEELQEKVYNRGTEEAPENGKESPHSARANGIISTRTYILTLNPVLIMLSAFLLS